ncbi:TRAP transporter small permease [Aureimonas fodinaquatilis]|uniref:TRAP transporter small permease protein n=1 Tax=Aureimonas fodinaquatilis TaxID=2565783 RepID=A0A5B0DXG5_9HYPH|nr:TRAP transporter small permease [Aureimonas fodinaquatilis]KAA0971186.1 TRAP transporter small permease [Aureimonas fodinaquatilis]
MIAIVRRISAYANWITEWLLVPIVLFFAGLLIVSVFSRYVFQLPIVSATELTRLAFVWATFLGISAGVKRGVHVRVVAFVSLLPKLVRGLTVYLVHGSFLVFGMLMIWQGWSLTLRMIPTTFPTLGISQAWLYAVLPVAGALMSLHALSSLLSGEPVDHTPLEEMTP